MSPFRRWYERFVRTVESQDCEPRQEEMIEGKAFTYKIYDFSRPHIVMPTDTFQATVREEFHGVTVYEEKFTQEIGEHMTIDAVAVFRCKDAFGMTNAIGAAFGRRKK